MKRVRLVLRFLFAPPLNFPFITIFLVMLVPTALMIMGQPLFMDEAFVLRGAAHLIRERTLNPPWHEWPPLIAYLAVPSVGLTALWGWLWTGLPPRDWAALAAGFHDITLVLPLRLLSCLSVFMVAWSLSILVRRVSRSLMGGLLAGYTILIGSPVVLQYGFWGLPDLPMVACGTIALMVVSPGLLRRVPWTARAVSAGLLVGIAAAFKFHGGLFLISVLALLALPRRTPWFPLALRCGLGSLLGFLTFAPTFLFASGDAFGGLAWLFGNLAKDRYADAHLAALIPPPSIAMALGEILSGPLMLGWLGLLIVFGITGQLRLNRYKWRVILALIATPAVTLMLVVLSQRRDGNYLLPALPGLVATMLIVLSTPMQIKCPPVQTWQHRLIYIVWFGAVHFTYLVFLLSQDHGMQKRDAEQYLNLHLPREATVLRVGGYTPKVWTPEEVAEFYAGPGQGLSPAGWERFYKRVSAQPQAARSLHLEERSTTPTQVLQTIAPGTWILTTDILRQRTRTMPRGNDGWGDFFDQLDQPLQFAPVYKSWGSSRNRQRVYIKLGPDGQLPVDRAPIIAQP
jgi:hypothetical protein